MFAGFPGETAEDMELTVKFLKDHAQYLDRVRFNAFSILEDTPIYQALQDKSPEYSSIHLLRLDHKNARAHYRQPALNDRRYRAAKRQALREVYHINQKRVRISARAFDGLM